MGVRNPLDQSPRGSEVGDDRLRVGFVGAPGGVAAGFEAQAALEETHGDDDEESQNRAEDPAQQTFQVSQH